MSKHESAPEDVKAKFREALERKQKGGGMDVSEARRLKALEEENAKLKRLYADAMLDNAGLKELLAKNV